MYKTFTEAYLAALDIIFRKYDGDTNDCVITENKLTKNARKTYFGFHFHDTDTNGEFVKISDGTYERRASICSEALQFEAVEKANGINPGISNITENANK